MGIGSFFKIPEHNVFDYKPRFYNPEQEERRERLRHYRLQQGKNPDIDSDEAEIKAPGSSIKGSFRVRMSDRKYRKRSSTIRFLVILAFLFFVAWLILVADLTSLINYFTK
jgi:hypothetical protein